LWEILWYLKRWNPKKAFRRLRGGGGETALASDVTVEIYYWSIRKVVRAFSPYFRLVRWKGVGIAVPPSYLEPLVRRFPRTLRLAAKADRLVERCPFIRSLADHVLLTFERTEAS